MAGFRQDNAAPYHLAEYQNATIRISDIERSLTDRQRQLVPLIAQHSYLHGSLKPFSQDILSKHIEWFQRYPIHTIKTQNAILEKQGRTDALAMELLALNTTIEHKLFPEQARDGINYYTYEERKGVGYIPHGAIMPGEGFRLGNPETWDRELLTCHKYGSQIHVLIVEAKKTGAKHYKEIRNNVTLPAAVEIFEYYIRSLYILSLTIEEPFQQAEDEAVVRTLGGFMKEGVCRHKASTLQLMLQEAGIPSRYVRGSVLLGIGNHAWNEVTANPEEPYSLILDPGLRIAGKKKRLNPLFPSIPPKIWVGIEGPGRLMPALHQFEEMFEGLLPRYLMLPLKLGAAKPENMAYIFDHNEFNTVWLPRQKIITAK